MPNCFALINKTTGERVKLQDVDDAMRVHFKAEPDPEHWFKYWYDTIGLAYAMGHSNAKIIELFDDPEITEMVNWLDQHYTVDAWAER
jgi:hypothetical protein